MLGEDGELVEEEDNPMAEDELPTIVKKAAVPKLLGQQKKVTTREVVGLINEEEEMVEAEELIINVTGATSGGTNILSVLRRNKLDRGVRMLHSQRKQRHLPKKLKMCRKQGKP